MFNNLFINRFHPKLLAQGELNSNEKISAIRDWVLPHWFERQNDPFKPMYTIGKGIFANVSCRNWTAILAADNQEILFVDPYGVIYLTNPRISIEIWIQTGENIFTPIDFPNITQSYCSENHGIETDFAFATNICKCMVLPENSRNRNAFKIKLTFTGRPGDTLKQLGVFLIVRPFDHDGLSRLKRIEYKDRILKVNNLAVLYFEKDLKHSFFSNEKKGDVTQYFRLGEGNCEDDSFAGLCTGLVGYSGLLSELSAIEISILSRSSWVKQLSHNTKSICAVKDKQIQREDDLDAKSIISTGTKWDLLIEANLNYLNVFAEPIPESMDIYQILALNRYAQTEKSHILLKECLKKVRWDGALSEKYLGPTKLIFAIVDYYKITNDYRFITLSWSIIRRIGYGLWYNKEKFFTGKQQDSFKYLKDETYYERFFWVCAALKSMEELSLAIGQINEAIIFKEQYLILWSRLLGLLAHHIKKSGMSIIPVDSTGYKGGEIVKNLISAYPLQLWERKGSYIEDTIKFISERYLFKGGIFSPPDFQGVDLNLTARYGQVLVREGLEYTHVLTYLLNTTSTTGSWPGRINPLTKGGIGEYGHDPGVLRQVLLLIRNIFVIEEGEFLDLLPGIFSSPLWKQERLQLNGIATFFGKINLTCNQIGDLMQIEYHSCYHKKPKRVRFHVNNLYKPVYADADFSNDGLIVEINPDFHLLRLKRTNFESLS